MHQIDYYLLSEDPCKPCSVQLNESQRVDFRTAYSVRIPISNKGVVLITDQPARGRGIPLWSPRDRQLAGRGEYGMPEQGNDHATVMMKLSFTFPGQSIQLYNQNRDTAYRSRSSWYRIRMTGL
jgi:hypothetical protein